LHPSPSLTTVDIDFSQIGYAAASMLQQLMAGTAPQAKHRYLRPTGITARQSSDFYAVEDELVNAALRFISNNLRKPIGVSAVCAKVFCSRRTLERRFKRVLGRSVVQEIVRIRVERAKRELAASTSSLKSIANAAGFPNAKRMYEVFLREVGVGPSEFREKLKAE
jgi:LacI family transcriptional regulator